MASDNIIVFVSWLVKRGLSANTINTFISGLRTIHLTQGIDQPALRPPIVTAIIEGKSHIDTVKARLRSKPKRIPVTLNVLRLLKATINSWEETDQMRLLVWTVCLICFFNDPAFTLLGRNIKLVSLKVGNETILALQILVKSPKEDRIGREVIIDVYETKGKFCPIKYYRKWLDSNPPIQSKKPAFLKPDGSPLTGTDLNKILKQLLSPHIDYTKSRISTHSFRGGMATLLGQIGFSDEQIQAMGRWSSRAFESYLKMPRTKRALMAKKLAFFCSK